jgi:TolB-like protein/Tfp pilus assembly protein PilF
MSEPSSPPFRVNPCSAASGSRLDSWKAIADYLGRHASTVQRWEQEEGLPVHRHQHEKRGSIYAYRDELDSWLAARSVGRTSIASAASGPVAAEDAEHAAKPPSAQEQQTTQIESMPDNSIALAAVGPAPWKRSIGWVLLVAVLGLTVAGVAETVWSTADKTPPTFSLAVLPLENRSPDRQLDYFVDGITEALMTDLAALSGIRVIARQSVISYRNSDKPASAIARELKVDALLEGAVQLRGERVRVDIRVIDANTSGSIWATTYERDRLDVLALQADISRAVVDELHLTLDPSQRHRLAGRHPTNPEAWDAYLRARFFWNKRTHGDMGQAVQWYERAIERDASFPLAYAGLADVYATLGPPNMLPSELISRGTAAAEKAIELDPQMGEPFAALGKLHSYKWDWRGAEHNYRNAIARAPGYAPARYWFGSFLANHRRCSEALLQAREAERIDPLSSPGNLVVSAIEMRCNRVEQAISRNRRILEFDPGFGPAYESLGRAYLKQGNVEDAIAVLQSAANLTDGRATVLASLAYAHAVAGQTQTAESVAGNLQARHQRGKALASAWSVAIVHAGLGHADAAISWLEHAYDDREEWLEALASDERLLRLHKHDRFQRLLYRLGLPHDEAAASGVSDRSLSSLYSLR